MKSRVVRIVLFLLVVLAFGAAAYNISTLEQQQAAVRAAARAFGEDARQAESAVTELKAARYAYVAPGQGVNFWTEKSAALASSIATRLKKLQQDATAPSARAAVADAAQVHETAKQVDSSAQAYIRDQQALLAADLIFGDLRQAQETIAARLVSAREEERASTDAALEAVRRMELATAGGAALFALLVLLILLPAGARRAPAAEDSITGLRLGSIAPTPAPPAPRAHVSASASNDLLPRAARLCTDFARLKDTSELPALLERLAGLLDAVGIIVWISDPVTHELKPAAAHGYAANALTHIRAISSDADNATAGAFRQGAVQVVEAEGSGNGAIAVPLVTPDGCVGVMAAEVRAGGERQVPTQAVATIVAAQIATLVAPQDTPDA
ncbi:MAG: GAF domain-containing protein [Bacteroidales bacterium]